MSEQQNQPLFGIEKLYLKDMSLEIPHAPEIFLEREAPQVEVNVHNQAKAMAQEGLFEVVLTVTVTAKIKEKTLFLVEVAQAGIFQVRNIAQPDLDAVLGTICPNTLLPYAREAVAGAVWRAGLPPVTLQHMSFDAIYQQRLQELQQQQQQQPAQSVPPATH
jgi:preprotein translocase subunit SecB